MHVTLPKIQGRRGRIHQSSREQPYRRRFRQRHRFADIPSFKNLLINFAVTLVAGDLRFDAQVCQRIGSIEGGKFFLNGLFRTLKGHRLALHQQLRSAEGLLLSELEGRAMDG